MFQTDAHMLRRMWCSALISLHWYWAWQAQHQLSIIEHHICTHMMHCPILGSVGARREQTEHAARQRQKRADECDGAKGGEAAGATALTYEFSSQGCDARMSQGGQAVQQGDSQREAACVGQGSKST